MGTYPKAPRSPHTSPTTGAIAEELGWTPQNSPGMTQLHAKHTNAYSLLPPLDTKVWLRQDQGPAVGQGQPRSARLQGVAYHQVEGDPRDLHLHEPVRNADRFPGRGGRRPAAQQADQILAPASYWWLLHVAAGLLLIEDCRWEPGSVAGRDGDGTRPGRVPLLP